MSDYLVRGDIFHLRYGDSQLNRYIETDVILLQPFFDCSQATFLRVSDLKNGIWRPFEPNSGEQFEFGKRLGHIDIDAFYEKIHNTMATQLFDIIKDTPDLYDKQYIDGIECTIDEVIPRPHCTTEGKKYPVKEGSAEFGSPRFVFGEL